VFTTPQVERQWQSLPREQGVLSNASVRYNLVPVVVLQFPEQWRHDQIDYLHRLYRTRMAICFQSALKLKLRLKRSRGGKAATLYSTRAEADAETAE
jgi:hypothetical protein